MECFAEGGEMLWRVLKGVGGRGAGEIFEAIGWVMCGC